MQSKIDKFKKKWEIVKDTKQEKSNQKKKKISRPSYPH